MKELVNRKDIIVMEDHKESWETIDRYSSFLSGHLQEKYEYGLGPMASERGFQMVTSLQAGSLAYHYKLDARKAESLCRVVGQCFPPFGSAGMAVIMDYARKEGYNTDSLCANAVESIWVNEVPAVLDRAVRDYFDNREGIPEVNFVRYCQYLCGKARELCRQGIRAGEALNRIFDDCLSEDPYDPQRLYPFVWKVPETIPEEIHLVITDLIEKFRNYKLESRWNKSEEEALSYGLYEAISYPGQDSLLENYRKRGTEGDNHGE